MKSKRFNVFRSFRKSEGWREVIELFSQLIVRRSGAKSGSCRGSEVRRLKLKSIFVKRLRLLPCILCSECKRRSLQCSTPYLQDEVAVGLSDLEVIELVHNVFGNGDARHVCAQRTGSCLKIFKKKSNPHLLFFTFFFFF